ncbi:MAG: lipid-A-disaccharide synthase [Planctomycetes bacterium]|nr:lipid-A-disaccharide synthase [Planctomycetota bacterium]
MPDLLVIRRVVAEAAGALVSPLRLLLYGMFGRRAETERVARALAAPHGPPPPPRPRPAIPREGRPLKLLISTGEASGEIHACNLVRELRARRANIEFYGFGGDMLGKENVKILLSLSGKAGMGLLHGLAAIPRHVGFADDFVKFIDRERPDACVFIDNPGFHLVLATLARERGVPAIQYVCPQTWAWAPWRRRRMRRDLAAALAIAPFEIPYFQSYGIDVRYVGHPLADEFLKYTDPPRAPEKLLLFFPGSRSAEVRRNFPAMLRLAVRLSARLPEFRFVASFRDAGRAAQARELLLQFGPAPVEIHEGDPGILLSKAALAVAKSGTGTLEIAHARVPQIIIYRLGRKFDQWLSRALLAVPHISMLNLLSNARIVPEFMVSDDAGEDDIYKTALEFLEQPARARRQIVELAHALERVEAPGACARAAEITLQIAERARVAPSDSNR